MKDKISEIGIAYRATEDQYILVLERPNKGRSIGKYGRMQWNYLEEPDQMMFNKVAEEYLLNRKAGKQKKFKSKNGGTKNDAE